MKVSEPASILIKDKLNDMNLHLYNVTFSSFNVKSALFFFKFDSNDKLWFLFAYGLITEKLMNKPQGEMIR